MVNREDKPVVFKILAGNSHLSPDDFLGFWETRASKVAHSGTVLFTGENMVFFGQVLAQVCNWALSVLLPKLKEIMRYLPLMSST